MTNEKEGDGATSGHDLVVDIGRKEGEKKGRNPSGQGKSRDARSALFRRKNATSLPKGGGRRSHQKKEGKGPAARSLHKKGGERKEQAVKESPPSPQF